MCTGHRAKEFQTNGSRPAYKAVFRVGHTQTLLAPRHPASYCAKR
jgi:hypothetical protein